MNIKQKYNLPDLKDDLCEKILTDGMSAIVNDCGIEYVWNHIKIMEDKIDYYRDKLGLLCKQK